jgi:transglutaminase-like putative cysteine protease
MDKPETPPQAQPPKPPFYQRKEFPPLAVFGGFVVILLLSTAFSGRPPSIDRVSQEDNLAAEIVTIAGKNFGAAGAGGEVRVGDLALTTANYLKWSDEQIVVSIPREIPSGIIYVVTKNGKCRGDIYMNPDEIPRLTSYRGPLIESLSTVNLAPGAVLVIKGERFGAERGTGRVSFAKIVPTGDPPDDRDPAEQLVNASEADADYVLWSDQEIRVRVPDGAKTGPVTVVTDKGQSNYRYVTVMSPVGRREYGDRVSYRLSFGAQVSVTGATPPNSLALLIPRPVACPEQRRIGIAGAPSLTFSAGSPTNSPPVTDGREKVRDASDQSDLLRLTLSDLSGGESERVAAEVSFDRYAVATEIDPHLVTALPDPASAFYAAFTGDDPSVKPSHPALVPLLRAAAGTEKNPYLLARRLYDYVVDQLAPGAPPAASQDWYALAAAKQGDALVYASLFTALARKAGIPARLVAGYVVDDARSAHPHYWSEFYIETFGWVPVDPFLGDDRAYGPDVRERRAYYFGNLDNRHIAVAKGFRTLPKPDPPARTAVKPGVVGLQPYHERIDGGLEAYASAWDDVAVVEMK